jgi:O-antigen ligase
MSRFRDFLKYPGVVILVVASAVAGGVSQPAVAGCFLAVVGVWVLAGGVAGMPPKGVVFWWGAWVWGLFGLLPPWGAETGMDRILVYQPWVALESLVLFLTGLTFFTWWLANPVGERARLQTLRLFGGAVAIFGLLALMAKVQRWPLPFLDDAAGYGFFPNRNHMSNWLALGGISSAVAILADARKQRWPWVIVSFISVGGVLTCLAANSSRGGLLVFFLGLVLWAAALAWAGPNRILGIILLILTLLAATTLLFTGAKPLERMRDPAWIRTEAGPGMEEERMNLDFRLLAAKDAIGVVAAHPFRGFGPGNFEHAFPPYRTRTFTVPSTMGHPENDWLWFACEYGLPALMLAGIGTCLLFRNAAPGKNREGWITRSGCAAAVAAFLLHGLMDVPGHRPGAVMAALMLAGLAFARKRQAELVPATAWLRALIWVPGALVVLAGIFWLAGLVGQRGWPALAAAERAKAEVVANWRKVEIPKAVAGADRGLSSVPMDPVLRFLKGKTLLMFEEMEDAASREFSIQKNLQPFSIYVRLDQAFAWAEWVPDQPERALEAYRDALLLAEKFPVDAHTSAKTVLDSFSGACRLAPGLRPWAASLWRSRPNLYARWLNQASPEEFFPALAALRATDPDLADWDAEARQTLFLAWARKGDRDELVKELVARSGWQQAGWPILAQIYIQQGKKKEAVELVLEYLPTPTLPGRDFSGLEAERRWYRSPRDASAAFVLAETRRENGDLTGARVVLEKMTERPETPAYFWWLQARVEAAEKRWDPATASLLRYLEKAVKDWPRI